MNYLEKFLYFLQKEMETPKSFGRFHCMWILLAVIMLIILFFCRKRYSEKQLKIVLFTYSFVALFLEILKQLIWSFNYDAVNNIVTWDYQWYSFPLQLCTTPIYVCLICCFLKNNKIKDYLLSYLSYVTILGSIATIIIPDSCFTSDILVNIHTMWLHVGSFVVSVYLLMVSKVKINLESLRKAIVVFLLLVGIANTLNIFIYQSGILMDETFNMFYISPYFISTLPLFDIIQQNVIYIVYLLTYIFALSIGAIFVYYISLLIKKLVNKSTL